MQTFADTFVPRRISQAASQPVVSLIGARPEMNFDTRSQAIAAEQIRHFRLWNYIAIDANAEKVSESKPNVGVLQRVARPQQKRQKFFRQFYPGIVKNDLDDAVPVPDSHPLVELLERINEYDWWETFCYETIMFYELTGSFHWWVIPNQLGLPAELYVIPSHWIRPEYSRTGELLKWWVAPYCDESRKFDVPPDQVIRGMKKNPHSKIEPYAPGFAGAEWIINNELIEKARHSTYRQGTLQNVLLTMDKEVYPKPPEESYLNRIGDKFMMRHGGIAEMHRPIVMPPGIDVTPFGVKPNEMILPEVSDQIRDYVLALHRVPRAIAGISHDLNVASIHGANLIWCTHKIIPLQRFLAGFMTEHLAKRYDPRLVVWFDDCRPHDSAEEREEWKLDWAMGAVTPDERRLYRGYGELGTEGSQKTFVSASVIPLDFAAEETEPEPAVKEEPPQEDEDAKKEQAYRERLSFAVRQNRKRARLLKQFRSLHRRMEKRAEKSLQKFWAKVADEAASRMDQAGDGIPPVDDILPEDKFQAWFNRAMQQHWLNQWAEGAEFERRALGLPREQSVKFAEGDLPDISVEFPPTMRRRMAEYLRQKTQAVWQMVRNTTKKSLDRLIGKSLNEGKGVREIRNQIMDELGKSKKEAITIARTEATASLNAGQQALREEEDVPNKQWIATVDGLTRETHSATDLEIVPNGQPFLVGGYPMNHPGDGSLGAPAEEIVNCRCCATGTFEEA